MLTPDDAPSCGTTSPRFELLDVYGSDQRSQHAWGHRLRTRKRGVLGEALRLPGVAESSLREDSANRQRVRRDGNVRTRVDGSRVLGPFTIDVRKRILERLKLLETETGWDFLSPSEFEVIEDIWRRDSILATCRTALDDSTIRRPAGVQA